MPKLILPQKNLTIDVESGANLMNALLAVGIPVASSCQGDGICSMCRMKIKGQLNPPENYEVESLVRNKCEPDERLSCQIVVLNDLEVRTKYW